MIVYVLSHNGLGDNLYMNGALHFIRQFYDQVFFLCKQQYYENVQCFFDGNTNITCIPICTTNEYDETQKILDFRKYIDVNTDIMICGPCHKCYLPSKITNKRFIEEVKINKNYTIDYDTITSSDYSFIESFYNDIGLNLTYFYEYFYLPTVNESIKMYDSIKKFYIVFIQYKCSSGTTLNISNLINKCIHNDKIILLCNDVNLYNKDHSKYALAEQFVNNKLINYVDTIKNSDEIYLIDSCFVGIVLPLLKTNQLKARTVRIITLTDVHKHIF